MEKNTNIKRVAVLFSRLSDYMQTCLKTLHNRYGVQLLVVSMPPSEDAPFDPKHFEWIENHYNRAHLSEGRLREIIENFEPDVLLISGWFDKGYLRVARAMRRKGILVIAGSDAQWNGSLRQRIGRLIAPWYLHSAIDVIWGAGDRQRQLANRLGYSGDRYWQGVYACDWDKFAYAYSKNGTMEDRSFLFVGRYVKQKGVDILLEAYRKYRQKASNPWPLVCAGSGKFEHLLVNEPGVINKGFVQPEALPSLMKRAGAFILPSRREPWGVVIQEAAAAGLPLICSTACGAAVHLVQDGYNGFVVECGHSEQLAEQMLILSAKPRKDRKTMGQRSHDLSKQYLPSRWAETLVEGAERALC